MFHSIIKVIDSKPLIEEMPNINLPRDFIFISALQYEIADNLLFLASRSGALFILDLSISYSLNQTCIIYRKIHSSDAITAILVRKETLNEWCVCTVGRDGFYVKMLLSKIHQVQEKQNHLEYADYGFKLNIVFKTRVTKGVLEGIYDTPDGSMLLVGSYESKMFVYNETKKYYVCSVETGGSSRVWSFSTADESLEDFQLAFIREGKGLVAFRNREISPSMMTYDPKPTDSYHCQETRAVVLVSLAVKENQTKFVISGGEDEILTVHLIDMESQQVLKKLNSNRTHSASIRCLHYQEPTGWNPSHYLFSAGSSQKLVAWSLDLKLSNGVLVDLRCLAIAVAPPTSDLIEPRIMDVSSLPVSEKEGYLVATAGSDMSIRLWKFSNGLFSLLDSTDYHHRCVQKSKLIVACGDIMLVSAATDGSVCIWKIDNNYKLSLVTSCRPHQSGVKAMHVIENNDRIYVATGGDDNAVAISIVDIHSVDAPKIQTILVPSAHGSSVVGCYLSLDLNMLYTVAIDQRINQYRIHNDKLEFQRADMIGIADPGDIDCHLDANGNLVMAIVGHGIQIVDL